MRLNTVLKIVGLSAALATPFALVGCDDDEPDTVDGGSKDSGVDGPGGGGDKKDSGTPGSDARDSGSPDTNVPDTAAGDTADAA